MHNLPIVFSLLVPSLTLPAQSVTATVTALTPLSAAGTVNGQTVTASQPAGPLAPTGWLLVQPVASAPFDHQALVAWSTYETEAEASVTLEHRLQAATAPSQLQAGVHEFLITVTASAPAPGMLRLETYGTSSPFAFAPLLSVDIGNDGSIDFPNISGGSGTIDFPSVAFGPQPVEVRVIASAALQGAGFSSSQFLVRALPAADATIWTSAIGCGTVSLFHQPVFQDRGIDFRALSFTNPTVLVIGLSQQPVLLPMHQGTTCLLLPAADIVLWNPTGAYHVPLTAALRPVTFHAQGVEIAPTGFLPTNAIGVSAF